MKLKRKREIKDKIERNQKIKDWIELWQIPNQKQTLIYRNYLKRHRSRYCTSSSVFWLIDEAFSDEWMWRFWQPKGWNHHNSIKKHPPLKSYLFNIKCLRSIFSIDFYNILSLVSQDHSFRHYVVWVGTIKHSNLELQASKSSKSRSDWKTCTPSTKYRWF